MQDPLATNDASPVAQNLTTSLNAALNVAGRARDDGRARPLYSTEIQRKTGIARSTVRSLINPTKESGPNPDLRTLAGLAKVIGIPAPFLLMGCADWTALFKAIAGLSDVLEAARSLAMQGKVTSAKLLLQILTELKVHPELPPYQGREDKVEKMKMDARNQWREHTCRVFSALIDRHVGDYDHKLLLIAFSASYVIHSTPNNPKDALAN